MPNKGISGITQPAVASGRSALVRRSVLATAVMAACATHGPVSAQESALEEILVTAQQREASLQDVPIAISAFSQTDIQKNMFRDVTDFVARTPNASFITNGARADLYIVAAKTDLDAKGSRGGVHGFVRQPPLEFRGKVGDRSVALFNSGR